MKVHWHTYNHCLFVLYLASVGYGWISYTNFLKFSDKDWIWICKNFSDMDQELKNQYPLTSALSRSCHLCSEHVILVMSSSADQIQLTAK